MSRRTTTEASSHQTDPDVSRGPDPKGPAVGAGATQILDRLPGAQAAELLLHLGQTQGNGQAQRTVQRYTTSPGVIAPPTPTDSSDMDDEPVDIATRIYDSTRYTQRNVAQIPRLLANRSASARNQIAALFQDQYGDTLEDFIAENLYHRAQFDGEVMSGIEALAQLKDGNAHGVHTQVAMCIIPKYTRDVELMRLLKMVSAANEQGTLVYEYRRVFGKIGYGELKDDLEGDLMGNDERRAVAMIHHQFTDAEELWLTENSDGALKILQDAWAKGSLGFTRLNTDWHTYVVSMNQWTTSDLRDHLLGPRPEVGMFGGVSMTGTDGPLNPTHQRIATAIFDGWDQGSKAEGAIKAQYGQGPWAAVLKAFNDGPVPEAPTTTGNATKMDFLLKDQRLLTDLHIANASLQAATVGEDVAQMRKQAEAIGRLHQERMALAESSGDEAFLQEVTMAWKADKTQLASGVSDEINEGVFGVADRMFGAGGAEVTRARLLMEGKLTYADKLWIAEQEGDRTKTIAVLTEAWAKKQFDALIAAAAVDRTDHTGEIIRPSFNPATVADQWVGTADERRVASFFSRNTDTGRGMARLRMELAEGNDDVELKRAYDFITTEGVAADLQRDVILIYTNNHVTDEVLRAYIALRSPDTKSAEAAWASASKTYGTSRFMEFLLYRFSTTRTYYDFLDLLKPPKTMQDIVERAEGRHAADVTGVDRFAAEFDLGAEDRLQVAEASVDRLRFIRDNSANPAELAALMRMTGANTPLDLGKVEYGLLKERLAEIKAFRESFADIVGKIGELAMTAALTWLSGGAYLVLIGASATMTNLLIKEGVLGGDFNVVTVENGLELAKGALATAAAGKVGKFFDKGTPLGMRMEMLGARGTFIKEVAGEGTRQVTTVTANALQQWQPPSGYTILGGIASTGLGGAGGVLKSGPTVTGSLDRYLQLAKANAITTVGAEAAEEMTALGNSGVSGLSDGDIFYRFSVRTLSGLLKSVPSTAGEFGGEITKDKQEAAGKAAAELLAEHTKEFGSESP
jgi:hypothetical protein